MYQPLYLAEWQDHSADVNLPLTIDMWVHFAVGTKVHIRRIIQCQQPSYDMGDGAEEVVPLDFLLVIFIWTPDIEAEDFGWNNWGESCLAKAMWKRINSANLNWPHIEGGEDLNVAAHFRLCSEGSYLNY